MGFSVSASTAILLLAAFASVGMLYSSAYNGFESVTDATIDQQDQALAAQNAEISIVNTSHNTTGTTDYVNFTVQNTGSETLHVSHTDILLDGTYRDDGDVTLVSTTGEIRTTGSDGTDLWYPQENLTVSFHENTSKPIYIKVVADRGVAASEVIT